MDDRIDAALAELAPHILSPQDPLYFRAVLEDLHDGAQDDLLASLRGARDAAAEWNVTLRRASAHIARLHSDIDRYRPDPKYKRK